MQIRCRAFRAAIVIAAILAPGALAQDIATPPATAIVPPGPTATTAPGHADLFDRVAVIGASATAGFGARVELPNGTTITTGKADLATVFEASLLSRDTAVTENSSFFFYLRPMRAGPALLNRALARDPTLVVAVDFLFWFGYGHRGPDGRPIRSEQARLDLLEEGLALLESVSCPLVVGDYPDMSPAVGLMLSKSQVPRPKTLIALNRRLREWARERPDVVVLPLARLVDRMRSNQAFVVGDHHWPEGSKRALLQLDELHPTATGLVALVQLAAEALHALAPAATDDAFDLDPERVRGRVREMLAARILPRAPARVEHGTE